MHKKETYFTEWASEVGFTHSHNKLTLRNPAAEFPMPESLEMPFISEDKDGNMRFLVYDLDGEIVTYIKESQGKMAGVNDKELFYYVTRLITPRVKPNGEAQRYDMPKAIGTRPWISPNCLKAFKDKLPVDTLVITEGYKKAVVGWLHGLHIMALAGITTYREKGSLQIHNDIVRFITTCKVKNIIILWDGDALNISGKALEEGKDLYHRPGGFFNAYLGIRESLKDYLNQYNIDLYAAHIQSESAEGSPKGLDDMLIALKEESKLAIDDLLSFSKGSGVYVWKANITGSTSKLKQHFKLNTAQDFYNYHSEHIKERQFIWLGTNYQNEPEKNELKIVIPAVAKNYFRVGDQYYEFIKIPNKHKQLEKTFHGRKKSTITDDHGKNFTTHIVKYKAFCNVPDHENYTQVLHNCFNIYGPFDHEPEEGDCPVTREFMTHIFGEQYELGMDYVQMLYKNPTHILPILCLVSRENNTGKSTFIKWLKSIFMQNMIVIGNDDLQNQFNAHYASKLIVCCEESFIDKKTTIEKIKAISTNDRITMNAKGRDVAEIDCFIKFILVSNNEENFINAGDDDIRYWVRKVPRVKKERNILSDLIAEIPFFIHYLNTREMKTKDVGSRMWFTASDIQTEALKKVREFNRPTVEKEIRDYLRQVFLDFGVDTLYMSVDDVRKEIFNNKYERNYVGRILIENLRVDNYKNETGQYVVKRYEYPRWDLQYRDGSAERTMLLVRGHGRPIVFHKSDFITDEESANTTRDPELDNLLIGKRPEPAEVPSVNGIQDELPF